MTQNNALQREQRIHTSTVEEIVSKKCENPNLQYKKIHDQTRPNMNIIIILIPTQSDKY